MEKLLRKNLLRKKNLSKNKQKTTDGSNPRTNGERVYTYTLTKRGKGE